MKATSSPPAPIDRTEAARRLGLRRPAVKNPERVILNMVKRGELIGIHVGRWLLVDPDSVDRFLEGRAE